GRKRAAALAHWLVEALRQHADELPDVYVIGGALDHLAGDPVGAEADVVRDGSRKEKRILQHHAVTAAQIAQVHLPEIDSIQTNASALDVIKTQQQGDDRSLAGAGVADDSDGFSGFGCER